MDELTRERFWPRPLPPMPDLQDVVTRQMVLVGLDPYAEDAEAMQQMRMRADALLRSRRLARAIRIYRVRGAA